ncbi:hypothetical protein ACQKGA_10245 [Priestia megaterium]|jgi:hypothetical protein|uniref:hypothetical protein n=1 Tax=Priestia TaxID=2800373 RepID=UPI0005C64E8D|nr:hypothetical protein [Priestia megaterium]MCF8888816.1 hypothetical protein [Priestia megaterium]MEB2266705.1 hypothetical protein [Priestia megaterium]NEW01467.1 hypothetical protein [Priestia megaterium]NGY82545.1 hypothetical protein [Priestia megaterium]
MIEMEVKNLQRSEAKFRKAESEYLNKAIEEYFVRRTYHNAPVVDALRYVLTIDNKREHLESAVELFGDNIKEVNNQDIINYLNQCRCYKEIRDIV